MTSVTVLNKEFENIIDNNIQLEKIASGFIFTEGPIWHPINNTLLFSDMPGDIRRKIENNESTISVVKQPANKCNGMTYDRDFNLIVCEHSTSSVVIEYKDGTRETLASHFNGKELNSPNDVCIHSKGFIYFSDPWYGRMPVYGIERPRELGFQGVYKIDPTSKKIALVVDKNLFSQPNGLCFSPDENYLYVNDTEQALIRVFDVNEDGSLSNQRIFAEGISSDTQPGAPDGMKCDALGNIWVTAPEGIWVYSPKGMLLGKIKVPEMVGNLTWGGNDLDELYIAASTSIYRLKTRVLPRQEPYTKSVLNQRKLSLKACECALIIQDMQNDVVSRGGVFANEEALNHAAKQNVINNIAFLADEVRKAGGQVIHVNFVVEDHGVGLSQNAPIFNGIVSTKAVVRGCWGAKQVDGIPIKAGDLHIEKMHMSSWEGTNLESLLKATGKTTIIDTGAWTNMCVEHTARTGADKGFNVVVPQDCCSSLNNEWHQAAVSIGLPNVATVTSMAMVVDALHANLN